MSKFKASLLENKCSSLEVSCDCSKITFRDTSNYGDDDATLPGHGPSDFTSRTITITKGDGSLFYLITEDVRTNNPTDFPLDKEGETYKIILPQATSTNLFTYNFTDTDEDGIWAAELCTYPNWRADVEYTAFLKPIVLRDGKTYIAKATSTGVDPLLDVDSDYWEEYTKTSTCSDTRYCTSQRVVVLCIAIDDCYRKAVAEAFCGIEVNPCSNICENSEFLKAMKMRVVMDGLHFAACAHDWTTAEKHMDILKTLCCCN